MRFISRLLLALLTMRKAMKMQATPRTAAMVPLAAVERPLRLTVSVEPVMRVAPASGPLSSPAG